MPHGLFTIGVRKFDEHHLSNDGADRVEFKGDKPGSAAAAIAKVASGGRTVAHCAGYSGDYRAQNGNAGAILTAGRCYQRNAAVVGKLTVGL